MRTKLQLFVIFLLQTISMHSTYAVTYTPMQLNFVKDYQVRNFFSSSILLNKLDFTTPVVDNSAYSRINLTGSLTFNQTGQILTISNTGNTRAESYLKMGKLYHYAAIDMDITSQNSTVYTANAVLSLYKDAANRIVIVQRDNDAGTKTYTMEIFKNGSSVFNTVISASGIAVPYTLRVHVTGRYLNFFRVKDGVANFYSSVDIGSHFDLRNDDVIKDFSVCLGARLDPSESVSFSRLEQYLSSGTGQADPRVLHYEDGAPIIVDNKIWFAMTTRGYDPIPASHQGIYSYDLMTREWQLTGDMSFDNGDGFKRPWHATDIFFDRKDRKWKFFTTSHGDDHKIYYGVCNNDPRFGISEVAATLLNTGIGQGEDPSVIYDAVAGKWRLAMCQLVTGGFNTVLLESDNWNGPYTQIAINTETSSTGILIQKTGGNYYVFQGRGNGNYEILSYPGLVKLDVLKVAPLLTDRNIWPVIIPVTSSTGTTYNFLTFDREQVTGTYSYGNIHWYHAAEVATDFYEYDPGLTDPSTLTELKRNGDEHFRVYPNPAKNNLNIYGLDNLSTATIRNTSGQLILEKETTGTLEISGLKPGVYFLNIGADKATNFIKSDL